MSRNLCHHVCRFGVRFLSTSDAYDRDLRAVAKQTAQEQGCGHILREGVYCMVTGPTYETVAECRLLQTLGADAVGKSQELATVVSSLKACIGNNLTIQRIVTMYCDILRYRRHNDILLSRKFQWVLQKNSIINTA